MAAEISEELKAILSDGSTIKVLASLKPDGNVHSAVKESIFADDNGGIVYLEYFEKSQTNINLVNSIWFDREISITAVTSDKRSFFIKGRPYRTRVFGKEYEKFYREAEANDSENDLAAVYYIEPTEIYEQTFSVQRSEHKAKYPLYVHLDKFA